MTDRAALDQTGEEAAEEDEGWSDAPTVDRPPRPSKPVLALVTVPLAALVVLAYVGEGLFPGLVDHPAILIGLAPSVRNFSLFANDFDPLTYYGFGIPRVLLSDPLYYLLGLWFGDAAVTWMERRTRTWGTTLRQMEQSFNRWGYIFLFALPYNFTPLLAGAARMPLRLVLPTRAAGIAVRLFAFRQLNAALEDPLGSLTDWISTYRVPLLGVTITLVVLSIVMEVRRGGTEVSSLAHLDEEMDEIDHAGERQDEAGTSPSGTAGS